MTYEEQLQDERWLWMKDQVMERDFRVCQHCMTGKNLQVHHRYYDDGKMAWEYPMRALITLCKTCHEREHDRVGRHPKDPMLKASIQLRESIQCLRDFIKSRF